MCYLSVVVLTVVMTLPAAVPAAHELRMPADCASFSCLDFFRARLPQAAHPPWFEFDESPCAGDELLGGAARAKWSCIQTLHGGPTLRPRNNLLFQEIQHADFDTQPAMMPQAGPQRSGGLLKRALPNNLLYELLADSQQRFLASGCNALSDREREDFNQLQSEKAPCRINMTGSLPFAEAIQMIHNHLQQWSGTHLRHANENVVFAASVLLYPGGSVLHAHVDRPDIHHVSATHLLHAQDMTDGWPLEVALWDKASGRYQNAVAVYAQPGDLVAYQGARWEHSRPRPLPGSVVAVMILHFRVGHWSWGATDDIATKAFWQGKVYVGKDV